MSCENNLFWGDSYDTPGEGRRSWLDKLLCGCRLHYYLRNFGVFALTGVCAKRGKLNQFRQIEYSNRNIRIVEACGGKIHIRGLDKLRALNGEPVVLIGNHMSSLETALLHAIVRPYLDFTFVIKESLLHVPFFGWIMVALDAIAVSRNNPREDLKTVLTRGKELLASGKSIILFPQASRKVEFNPESSFNSIGVKLARGAGVKIVPFALKTDFVGVGKYFREFGPLHREKEIYFEFSDPITITGNGKEELQQMAQFTYDRLSKWNRLETEKAE